ncbi:MAG: hypothetical protein K0S01_348 [Herbinix sp.]|jgi:hypothetical protein|nr:hypothetical protein [Herbinix sp.]
MLSKMAYYFFCLLDSLIKRLTYINFDYKTCYAIMQVNDAVKGEKSLKNQRLIPTKSKEIYNSPERIGD